MKKKHCRFYLFMAIVTILLHPMYAFSAESTDGISLPFIPKPELSSDGKTLYNASVHELLADEHNPNLEQMSIPAPEGLTDSATALSAFEFTYQLTGDKDPWGDTCLVVPDHVKEAFNYAGTIWGNIVKSSVPIKIQVCRSNTLSGTTLGVTGGGSLHRDFSNAPRSGTWYAGSLANSLAKIDLNTSNYDTYITYNDNIKWYAGKDAKPPVGYYDLVTFALHNICHGLNFKGSMSYASGAATWGYNNYPNIYDTFMQDGSGKPITNTAIYPNGSSALGAVVTSNNLWFHGSHAMAENGGRVKMYAPSPWNSGVSYNALDYNTFASGKNKLMSPFLSSGTAIHDPGPVTTGLLKDLGWTGDETAEVISLWPTAGAEPGKLGLLGALVENISSTELPSDAKVWFYVSGPTWTNWVGSKQVLALPSGKSDWYYFNWSIPSNASGGTYTYWARVYQGSKALSEWSIPHNFTVTGKSVMTSPANLSILASTTQTFTWSNSSASQYWLEIGTTRGGKDIFSQSVGTSTSQTVSGLPSTGITLYVRLWTALGSTWLYNNYTYMSYHSGDEGFVSQFNGSAFNWLQDSGKWSVGSSYYYTEGRAGYINHTTYNETYSDVDYSAKLWRSGSSKGNANRLIIRASGAVETDGDFSNLYAFQYTTNASFNVYKQVGGVFTSIKEWTGSTSIAQGDSWNMLRVKSVGNNLYFYINGTLVWSGTDTSLTSGRVGMGMYRDTTSTGNGFWADWAVLRIPTFNSVECDGTPDENVEMGIDDRYPSSKKIILSNDNNIIN